MNAEVKVSKFDGDTSKVNTDGAIQKRVNSKEDVIRILSEHYGDAVSVPEGAADELWSRIEKDGGAYLFVPDVKSLKRDEEVRDEHGNTDSAEAESPKAEPTEDEDKVRRGKEAFARLLAALFGRPPEMSTTPADGDEDGDDGESLCEQHELQFLREAYVGLKQENRVLKLRLKTIKRALDL
jgi:hypothetical protein